MYAHLEGAGHSGVDLITARFERHRVWEDMPRYVRDVTQLCLYCANTKVGALVPRTLEATSHERKPNAVVLFELLLRGGECGGRRH